MNKSIADTIASLFFEESFLGYYEIFYKSLDITSENITSSFLFSKLLLCSEILLYAHIYKLSRLS